ncbi:hypothetical protein BUMB_02578c [Candidatus Paraburkholderia calva]|nr:hypothetical protein BUMB_02578c [Candidatus Paraburkholderia calva]
MTEPLIVVEGNLRLPSLHPLAYPRLHFGREWSSARMRPVPIEVQNSRAAARLKTAYVEAVAFADRRAPYRPISLWGIFPDGRTRRSLLQIVRKQDPKDTPEPGVAPAVPPIPLTVRAPRTAQLRVTYIFRSRSKPRYRSPALRW